MVMLSKRPHHPMIGRLELLVSGNRAGFGDVGSGTSPRSPLDCKIQSPRGLKNYVVGGGVGLGIVAALEKCGSEEGREILAKYAICSPGSNKTSPIPVSSGKNIRSLKGGFEELETTESLENYTYVTSHAPNKSFTKVYYDGGEHKKRTVSVKRRCHDSGTGVSMPKEPLGRLVEDVPVYPTSVFLSSCHLCKKNLHGKDIYMYRGEKAFCSTECRSRQIMADEHKEQCRTEVPRSADVSSSPYTRSPIFSTGIVAI